MIFQKAALLFTVNCAIFIGDVLGFYGSKVVVDFTHLVNRDFMTM